MKTSILLLGLGACFALTSAASAQSYRSPYDGRYDSNGIYRPYQQRGGSHVFVDPRSNESPYVNRRSRDRSNPYRIPGFRSQFDSDED